MNPAGDADPLPGQLLLPGMPCLPDADVGSGQGVLPGLDDLRDAAPRADAELGAVFASLTGLDPDGSRMAAAIRGALDMLLDGQHTCRYRWEQLHKTDVIDPALPGARAAKRRDIRRHVMLSCRGAAVRLPRDRPTTPQPSARHPARHSGVSRGAAAGGRGGR